MWLPNAVYQHLIALGPRLDALDAHLETRAAREDVAATLTAIRDMIGRLETLDRGMAVAEGRAQMVAEIVAAGVRDELRDEIRTGVDVMRLESENATLRSRVVQQETTIKLLLQQLEAATHEREALLSSLLARTVALPTQVYAPDAPVIEPAAARHEDDPGAVESAMQHQQLQIRKLGPSAPAPHGTAVGTPGILPENPFDDVGDEMARELGLDPSP